MTFSAQLGPVWFRLDRVGLGLALDTSRPRAERNLRLVDARLAANPPLGIAVQVDAKLVSGGGSIFHDPVQGTYFGVLALRLGKTMTLKAIGLVATKQPDGSPGSSFIIIATIEGLGLQLGPVTLDGLGLLYASDRTFDETAMRAGAADRTAAPRPVPGRPRAPHGGDPAPAEHVLPRPDGQQPARDPRQADVREPADRAPRPGPDLPVGRLGVGPHDRARPACSSILPSESVRIVQLNLDAVGIFDPSAGTAALDAVLVDSKLCGRFPLTGAAAFRRVPGRHRVRARRRWLPPALRRPTRVPRPPTRRRGPDERRQPQADLPGLRRDHRQHGAVRGQCLAVRLRLRVQPGGQRRLRRADPALAAALHGRVPGQRAAQAGLDEPVQDLGAGALEGPLPLRISGKATFEILWWDYSISFDRTLVGGGTPVAVPLLDVLGQLRAVLGDARNWRAEAPDVAHQLVTVRRDDRPDQVLLHPMGSLAVQQGVVPLNLQRDIDRVGEAVPSDVRRFAITSASLGSSGQPRSGQTMRPVRDLFAPGQFFDMTDDDRLAAPSFEEMEAGDRVRRRQLLVPGRRGPAFAVRLHRHHDRHRRHRHRRAGARRARRATRARPRRARCRCARPGAAAGGDPVRGVAGGAGARRTGATGGTVAEGGGLGRGRDRVDGADGCGDDVGGSERPARRHDLEGW